jgi:hypothetical protein
MNLGKQCYGVFYGIIPQFTERGAEEPRKANNISPEIQIAYLSNKRQERLRIIIIIIIIIIVLCDVLCSKLKKSFHSLARVQNERTP